jgi:subfamily B ATP-binding cassette protein HlyB/CyaB
VTATTSSDDTIGSDIVPASGPALASLAALCLVARLHHVAAEPAHLAHQLGWPPGHEASIADILLAARHLGLNAKCSRSTIDRLSLAPLPALVVLADGAGATRSERIVVRFGRCSMGVVRGDDSSKQDGNIAISIHRCGANWLASLDEVNAGSIVLRMDR